MAAEYTQFLAGMPAHPSLDGIRAQLLRKRAAAYRLASREDLARKDETAVASIVAHSPYFLEGPGPRAGGAPAAGGPGVAEGPASPEGPGIPAPAPLRPAPRLHIGLGVGLFQLSQRQVRSDSRSYPNDTVDLEDDLGMGLETGIPELSLSVRGAKSKVSLCLDNWMAKFTGETLLGEPLFYDGQAYATGESVRSRLFISSTTIYLSTVPSANLRGKVALDLGIKHVYIDLRTSGSVSGTHADAMHVPMVYPGLELSQNVGHRISVGGALRAGGILWPASDFTMLALGIEARFQARLQVNDRLDLTAGAHFEYLAFMEEKSGGRRKEASLGIAGGFAEAALHF